LIPRYAGICKISTMEYGLHAKHMEKIVYNLNNMIPHNVRLVDPVLFTVGTVTGVIIMLLALLRLTGFLLTFCINFKHRLHKGHALIAPKLLVGLLGLRGLTCCYLEGHTIAVILATAVQGVLGLVGTAVGFATLAKLLTATLLRDSTSWAPIRLVL
jgi:hypothetical protein